MNRSTPEGKLTVKIIKNPHAPLHVFKAGEIYFVSAGTYQRKKFFDTSEKLSQLKNVFLQTLKEFHFEPFAYCLLPNHYHLIFGFDSDQNISNFIRRLHARSACQLNRREESPGRKVWYQYWDRCIRDEKEFFANLNYIFWNPVKHAYVEDPKQWEFTWVRDKFNFEDFGMSLFEWDNF